jgi:hypothetical protein
MRLTTVLALCACFTVAGCGDDTAPTDSGTPDLSTPDLIPPIDLATPDFGGINCGGNICGGGQVCCIEQSGMAAQSMCVAPADCGDGGVVEMCDGPEDCSSGSPNCCLVLDFSGVGVDGGAGPMSGGGGAACTAQCPAGATVGAGGLGSLHTKACHAKADCAGYSGSVMGLPLGFDSCCTGLGASTFLCVPSVLAQQGMLNCAN